MKKKPVYITGIGEGFSHQYISQATSVASVRDGLGRAGRRAMEVAGITPQDLDVAEIYAPFPCNEMKAYEALGFCRRGGAHELVERFFVAVLLELPAERPLSLGRERGERRDRTEIGVEGGRLGRKRLEPSQHARILPPRRQAPWGESASSGRVTVAAGAASWAFGQPFLTAYFAYWELPLVGKVPVASRNAIMW